MIRPLNRPLITLAIMLATIMQTLILLIRRPARAKAADVEADRNAVMD